MVNDVRAPQSPQTALFPELNIQRPRGQLLKWVGNKYRFAERICACFPAEIRRYYEPFVGTGAILATLQHRPAIATDRFEPLIRLWAEVRDDPSLVKEWYRERWETAQKGDAADAYYRIREHYNTEANPADLLYISRACYGGVMRFRKKDGYISTPVGPHKPISPESFDRRVDEWHARVQGVLFDVSDFEKTMERAGAGDLIYCDPPYVDSQAIVYGAQNFSLSRLVASIERAKARGALVALSIDGTKKSGRHLVDLVFPLGLFETDIAIDAGRSMLRRFQRAGESLEDEVVGERLLLTYKS